MGFNINCCWLAVSPGNIVNPEKEQIKILKLDVLPSLFKKFSRGKATYLMDANGTGLGLYVGKMMIEAHQGKIWAESEGKDKGAKFCFTLPVGKVK